MLLVVNLQTEIATIDSKKLKLGVKFRNYETKPINLFVMLNGLFINVV